MNVAKSLLHLISLISHNSESSLNKNNWIHLCILIESLAMQTGRSESQLFSFLLPPKLLFYQSSPASIFMILFISLISICLSFFCIADLSFHFIDLLSSKLILHCCYSTEMIQKPSNKYKQHRSHQLESL